MTAVKRNRLPKDQWNNRFWAIHQTHALPAFHHCEQQRETLTQFYSFFMLLPTFSPSIVFFFNIHKNALKSLPITTVAIMILMHIGLFFCVLTCTFSLLRHFTLNQHYVIMQNSAGPFNFRPDILVASHRSSALAIPSQLPALLKGVLTSTHEKVKRRTELTAVDSAKSIHCFYFCATSRHKNILLGTKSHSWVMQSWTRLGSFKNTALHVKLKHVSVIDFPVKHLAGCIF